jgi:hypothetical protein
MCAQLGVKIAAFSLSVRQKIHYFFLNKFLKKKYGPKIKGKGKRVPVRAKTAVEI